MPKLYSSQDLTNACTLYHSLQLYENDVSLLFLSARDKSVEVGFNYAQRGVKDLIAKVKEVEGLKEIPIFKNCIDKLTLLYDLKK